MVPPSLHTAAAPTAAEPAAATALMADDWEADDWERDDFKPVLPGAKAAATATSGEFETAGQAILAAAAEPDMSKFQDEEEQEEEEEQPSYHIKPQVRC